MGNLARKLQQEQQKQMVQPQKQKKIRNFKLALSPGEKILSVAFCATLCFGAVQILSNQAAIYDMNKSIQVTAGQIQDQKKVNNDLEMQVEELSTYERILAKAKELGLNLNENNVKVVR